MGGQVFFQLLGSENATEVGVDSLDPRSVEGRIGLEPLRIVTKKVVDTVG